jgi:type I restriction enzyme S subunit
MVYVTGPEQWHGNHVASEKWTTNPKRIAPENSIFIAVKGAGVGKMVFGRRAAIGRDVYAFEPHPGLDRKYVFWAIKQSVNEIVAKALGDIPGLSKADIVDHVVRLPNLQTQRAVVAKIEELFSELDKAVESLTLARAQLGTYRQALLKAAFEGGLTADWRAANPDKLEPPETLIARIRAERDEWYRTEHRNWNRRCDEWEEAGRIGPRPARPDPDSEPLPLRDDELQALPSLPAGWAYTRLSGIAYVGSGVAVSKSRQYEDAVEVPYLRVANVQRGHLDLSHLKTMNVERSQLPSAALRPLDVLFNEGGDRDKLGRGWVWEAAINPCVTQNHVFRATLYSASEARAKLLSHWGNTVGQDYFEKGGKQTTNLASINKTVLKALPVPVLCPPEAEALFQKIEASASELDATASEIDAGLTRIAALRQSILKQAFSGRLVPQDPTDEPASALLARLREEAPPARTRRRRRA